MRVLSNHYAVLPADTISYPMNRAVNFDPTIARSRGTDVSGDREAAFPGASMGVLELKLPLEIIESIIKVVDDRKDLKALSLSCSYFRQICQSRLFQNFRINCDVDDSSFQEGGMLHTIAHTDDYTNVAALIRWLKIENQYGGWGRQGGGKAVDHMLGKFVKRLKAVEQLELRGAGLEWRHGELAEGLIAALQLPTLRELKLASLEGFPMPLVIWGRALKRVEFESVLFMQSGMPAGSREPQVSPSLEELRMDNREMGLSVLRLHLLSSTLGLSAFTKLKKLRLEYRDSEGDRPEDINRLLSVCQSSLEDLVLFFTHDAYRSIHLYTRSIRLSRLINLRHFSTRVYITTRDGHLEEEHPFDFLTVLFHECPPSLESIKLLFFHRFGDVGDVNAPEASGWNKLDGTLASMSGLKEVSVVVCCTECTPSQMAAHEGVYDLPMTRDTCMSFRTRFTDNINTALEA